MKNTLLGLWKKGGWERRKEDKAYLKRLAALLPIAQGRTSFPCPCVPLFLHTLLDRLDVLPPSLPPLPEATNCLAPHKSGDDIRFLARVSPSSSIRCLTASMSTPLLMPPIPAKAGGREGGRKSE